MNVPKPHILYTPTIFIFMVFSYVNRDKSVGKVTFYGRDSIQSMIINCCILKKAHAILRVPPATYPMDIDGSYLGGKATRESSWLLAI
jgi:hypothetical protein